MILKFTKFGLCGDVTSTEDRVPPPCQVMLPFGGTPSLLLLGDVIYGWSLKSEIFKISSSNPQNQFKRPSDSSNSIGTLPALVIWIQNGNYKKSLDYLLHNFPIILLKKIKMTSFYLSLEFLSSPIQILKCLERQWTPSLYLDYRIYVICTPGFHLYKRFFLVGLNSNLDPIWTIFDLNICFWLGLY